MFKDVFIVFLSLYLVDKVTDPTLKIKATEH